MYCKTYCIVDAVIMPLAQNQPLHSDEGDDEGEEV